MGYQKNTNFISERGRCFDDLDRLDLQSNRMVKRRLDKSFAGIDLIKDPDPCSVIAERGPFILQFKTRAFSDSIGTLVSPTSASSCTLCGTQVTSVSALFFKL
jgi:hypothetical protein